MSIRLMSYVFDTDLPPSEKLVMLVLCDFANDQGERCHPSKNTVAEKSSLSKRQVQRVVKQLADRGLLTLVENAKGGAPGQTCHYHINVAALQRGVILSSVTGDNADDTDDTTSSLGVTSCPQGVTSAPQTGDVGVTRTTSKPSRTSSSGESDSSEDGNTATTTFADLNGKKTEADCMIEAHCTLHRELFELNLTAEAMSSADLSLAKSWENQGITAEFCRDVFRRRLMQRKTKGQSGVVNFRYWERVIPDEWSKRPKADTFNKPNNKPTAPRDISFSDKVLREKLTDLLPEGTDRQAWAKTEIDRLKDDTEWLKVRDEVKGFIGETLFNSWVKPVELLWKEDNLIGLRVSTRFMHGWIMNHYWQDIVTAWKRYAPNAQIVLTL